MRRGTAAAALLLPLAGLAAGCTPQPPLSTRLQPWVGRSELDLVATFGVPLRTYEVDRRRFLLFEDRRAQVVPSDPYLWRPYGRFGPVWQPSPTYVLVTCDVTFELRDGIVQGFSYRGDGCR